MHIARQFALIVLLGALGTAPCHGQRRSISLDDSATFSAEALMHGVSASKADCDRIPRAVWAQVETGEAECLRYWPAGLEGARKAPVLVYLPGDQVAGGRPDPQYVTRSPRDLQALAESMQTRAATPFILMSRPGLFGSSGDHKDRRSELEARFVSAALDAIKARHAIEEFALVGLSGGGHTVASMLAWRRDIACAVPASAVSSPRLRWVRLGLQADVTGRTDSHEPVEHLKSDGLHPRLRVFVMGDPMDTNVPWETQRVLATRLRALGVSVEEIHAQGSDGQRHSIGGSSLLVGALCARGVTTMEILRQAAQGLKG